jgi:hypothetical protein
LRDHHIIELKPLTRQQRRPERERGSWLRPENPSNAAMLRGIDLCHAKQSRRTPRLKQGNPLAWHS